MARAVLDRFDVTAVIVWVARSARDRVRNVQVCIGRWAQTPARIGLDRRADLSVVLRWGCDALILRGWA